STMTRERAEALLVFPSPMLFNERRRIDDLAVQHRLPSIAVAREFVELGGLMAYGASIPGLVRRSATYVDKIFKGARPGDLPVEEPTKFDLVINLKTAKAFGLAIPESLLQRADQVIERWAARLHRQSSARDSRLVRSGGCPATATGGPPAPPASSQARPAEESSAGCASREIDAGSCASSRWTLARSDTRLASRSVRDVPLAIVADRKHGYPLASRQTEGQRRPSGGCEP